MTTSPLWTASEIAQATRGRLQGDFAVAGISNDTRTLQPHDLYIALTGLGVHDGHDFVPAAFARGAGGVLVQQNPCDQSVLVDDTFAAMQDLGRAARARVSAACRIVAITGSVGKTTARALSEQALKPFGTLHASEHSLNNHWGVPLSLARMPRDTAIGVFEVGMNHAGEIAELTTQIRPHVAVITTVEAVHLEFFPTGLAGIARAKAEIFAGVVPGGAAVLNRDNSQYDLLVAEAHRYGIDRIISFGQHPDAHLRQIGYERLDQGGGRVTLAVDGAVIDFVLPLRGAHHATNALAALGAAYALNLDLSQAAAQFVLAADVAGRGNITAVPLADGRTITLVDDRHNSSPVALCAAITEFAHLPVKGRRILALGDMRELGETSPQLHAEIAPVIMAQPIAHVLTCGPMMQHLADALPPPCVTHYADSQAMAGDIMHHLQDGDAILVKGSRGAKMIDVVDALNRLSQTGG